MTDNSEIVQKSHFFEFWKNLNDLRKAEFYPDFELFVGQNKYKCHKIVLAARSATLRQVTEDGRSEYHCRNVVDHESAENILAYIYSGEVIKSETGLKSYILLASELGLADLVGQCGEQSLSASLTNENWIESLRLAMKYSLAMLQESCLACFREKCEILLDNKTLLSMELEEITLLFGDNDLMVKDEGYILSRVVDWVNACDERLLLCGDALRVVRALLIDLSPEEYTRWKKERVFQTTEGECLLDNMLKYRYSPSTRWELCGSQSRPRKGHFTQECFIAFEMTLTGSHTCFWNSEKRQWIRVVNNNMSMSGDVIGVMHGEQTFIFNAKTATGYHSQDLFSGKWVALPVPQCIKRIAAAVLGRTSIIILGDSSSDTSLSSCVSVEQYSLKAHTWIPFAPFPYPVKSPYPFYCNQKIYVIDGEASMKNNTRQLQILDTNTMNWSVINDDVFQSATTVYGAVCYDGIIYLDIGECLSTFDLVTLQLKRVCRLQASVAPRRSTVVLDGHIVIVDFDKLFIINPHSEKMSVVPNTFLNNNYVSFVLEMSESRLLEVVGVSRSSLSNVQLDSIDAASTSSEIEVFDKPKVTEEPVGAVASKAVQSSEKVVLPVSSMRPTLIAITRSMDYSYVWNYKKMKFAEIHNLFASPPSTVASIYHRSLCSPTVRNIALSVVGDHAYLFRESSRALEVYKANLRNGVLAGVWEDCSSYLPTNVILASSMYSVVINSDMIAVVAFSSTFLFTPSLNELKEIDSFQHFPKSPCVFLLNSNEVCILGGIPPSGSDSRKMFVWRPNDGTVNKVDNVLPKYSETNGILSVTWNNRVFLTMEDCIATISSNYIVSRVLNVNEDRRYGSMVLWKDRILIIGRKLPSAWNFDPANETMLQNVRVEPVDGFYWALMLPTDELAALEPMASEAEESEQEESQEFDRRKEHGWPGSKHSGWDWNGTDLGSRNGDG